ncbi:peptidoglycan DD-metalloendopeptidase family protein, partial [bacterium]|nr:peptidoglycan DD-metalloendopeptidase family protein [bacterium]
MPWPTAGKLANSFGSKRNGTTLRWQGVNINARQGSDVKAIHYGRVVFADWFRGSGLLVIIDHGDGYMSLYGHNQSLLKSPGEWVIPGESIATVGNSGGQKSAGLYFEIRKNGKPTDPKRWCKRT